MARQRQALRARRWAALLAAQSGPLWVSPIARSRHGCWHADCQAPRERPQQALRGRAKGGVGEVPERTGPGPRGGATCFQVH